ncbi:unnamed protein product [Peniophora sp. CBMAI 1063]|nr:unnamed protein product [Peniophora sp. CBMAI 1063]
MSSKKSAVKAPKSRPASTSALTTGQQDPALSSATLTAFSDDGRYLALLSLAVDKHRLRIFDSSSGQSVSEHVLDAARVSALAWTRFDASTQKLPADQPKSKKKRKADAAQSAPAASAEAVVVLGLSDGSLLIFSPGHGRVLRTLTHPSSTAAITALDASQDTLGALTIWSAGADSEIRTWDAQTGAHRASRNTGDKLAPSAIRVRFSVSDEESTSENILLAHHRLRLHSASTDLSQFKDVATFTGHASSVTALLWQPSTSGLPPKYFASIAEADRHVQLWAVPESASQEGALFASLPLDSDARSLACSTTQWAAVSSSGRVSLFDGKPPKKKAKVTVATPRCTIAPSAKGQPAPVVAVAFVDEERLRVARLIGGVKPVFDVVSFLDVTGDYKADVTLSAVDTAALVTEDAVSGTPTRRFGQPVGLAVQSGVALAQEADMDDLRDIDGALDVDLAELSLGQRLTALEAPLSRKKSRVADSEDHEEGDDDVEEATPITLTRTLIQALHSSDAGLLESCLQHTRAPLILQTVRRLPPQLAVPLLNACVERLGRGARGSTQKGRGGAAGTQRAAGLVRWVKTVLAVHSGHFMTMPDLVARLAGLHATLTARASLQDTLRGLSGRLDLVLQQMELRAAPAPSPLSRPGKGKQGARIARKYVEGESEEEGEGMDVDVDVDIEEGSEAGSVEDVELGGGSDEDSEEEEEYDADLTEEDEDENDEGDEGPRLNGFIDDEAEESDEGYSDEESD